MNKHYSLLLLLGGVCGQWSFQPEESIGKQGRQGRLSNTFKDKETLEFSYKAARLAKHIQAVDNVIAQQNWLIGKQANPSKPVSFKTKFSGTPIGRPKPGRDIFGYRDSMLIEPSSEHRENHLNVDVRQEQIEFANALDSLESQNQIDNVPFSQQQRRRQPTVSESLTLLQTAAPRPSLTSTSALPAGTIISQQPHQQRTSLVGLPITSSATTELRPFTQLSATHPISAETKPINTFDTFRSLFTTNPLLKPASVTSPVAAAAATAPLAPTPFIFFQ